MDGLRTANLGLRFLLELAMLAAFGAWGWKVEGLATAAALPVAAALVWGAFLSPRAHVSLAQPARLGLELVVFGLAAAACYGGGLRWLAVGFALTVAFSELAHWSGPGTAPPG